MLRGTSTWEEGKPALLGIRESLLFLLLQGKGRRSGGGTGRKEEREAGQVERSWDEAGEGGQECGRRQRSRPSRCVCRRWEVNPTFHLHSKSCPIYTRKHDLWYLVGQENESLLGQFTKTQGVWASDFPSSGTRLRRPQLTSCFMFFFSFFSYQVLYKNKYLWSHTELWLGGWSPHFLGSDLGTDFKKLAVSGHSL